MQYLTADTGVMFSCRSPSVINCSVPSLGFYKCNSVDGVSTAKQIQHKSLLVLLCKQLRKRKSLTARPCNNIHDYAKTTPSLIGQSLVARPVLRAPRWAAVTTSKHTQGNITASNK